MAEEELEGLAMAAMEQQTPPRPLKPLIKRAHRLLFRPMRVGVSDGRFFLGKFHCLDKQGNIILYDAVEYREISASPSLSLSSSSSVLSSATSQTVEQRSLGLVLIPSRCRTSCFVECSLDEQLSLLSLEDASA